MKYQVSLRPSFRGPSRRRAGIEVAARRPAVFELTKQQHDDLVADEWFVVTEAKDADKGKVLPNKSTAPKPTAPKPLTKQEMLDAATAEGLKLEVTKKNSVKEIEEAIEAARADKGNGTRLVDEQQGVKES